MRLRWNIKRVKILTLILIIFILYVSYKILQPDVEGIHHSENSGINNGQYHVPKRGSKTTLVVGKVLPKVENFTSIHQQQNESQRQKLKEKVKELVEKYRLDWGYQLKESPWKLAAGWVTPEYVHPENTPELGAVLKAMATRKITAADVGYKGTQLKMTVILEGNQKAVFKPKWFSRDHVIQGSPYAGQDRHNGEIAAFQLGRLLEFRLTPLAVGRIVNLQTEILPVAGPELRATFFKNGTNTCFFGKCHYCKGPETGVCGDGAFLEGTVVLWLPGSYALKLHKHPWARTYRKRVLAEWEKDDHYCRNTVLKNPLYSTGRRLLDLIDTAVFDFLIGNADRHHYETLGVLDTSRVLIIDNGKSFGNPQKDEHSILAPLYQCCRIRKSTWQRLQMFDNRKLSQVLQSVLETDPLAPVLNTFHLQALDRRLTTVLNTVKNCVLKSSEIEVFIKDR